MRVFEYFGSRELEPQRVRDLVADATGLTFEPRSSSYVGEYYQSGGPGAGGVVSIRPNELEDEDGNYLQWEEFAGYTTVVEARQKLAKAGDPADFLDELRGKLAGLEGIEFLRRSDPEPRPS